MGYQGLSLSKASYDFTNFTASFFSESPRDIFASQVTTLRTQGLITSKVHGFITDPDWSGYSTDLEHPSFEVAINKLDEFRDAQLAEIGNSRSTWGYLGEFWHERGLKTSALETAVFNEARNIQEQRIIYLDIVINLLKHQKEICQR
jgi:hypothetical protein